MNALNATALIITQPKTKKPQKRGWSLENTASGVKSIPYTKKQSRECGLMVNHLSPKEEYWGFDSLHSRFLWPDSQVVRRRSAKSICAGAIPARAFLPMLQDLIRINQKYTK